MEGKGGHWYRVERNAVDELLLLRIELDLMGIECRKSFTFKSHCIWLPLNSYLIVNEYENWDNESLFLNVMIITKLERQNKNVKYLLHLTFAKRNVAIIKVNSTWSINSICLYDSAYGTSNIFKKLLLNSKCFTLFLYFSIKVWK